MQQRMGMVTLGYAFAFNYLLGESVAIQYRYLLENIGQNTCRAHARNTPTDNNGMTTAG